ncbi:MAG: hypothetical protein J6Y66_01145 [Bacteroidales bacterium]|nr:hypothetical protein [Bacteroidales bacterium]
MKRIPLIAVLLAAATSCSLVLEDRRDCPAFVFFSREDGEEPGDRDRVLVKVMDGDTMEELSADDPLLEKLCSDSYSIAIPKREEILSCGVTGMRVGTLEGNILDIPAGNQGDPIYRFCKSGPLEGEEFRVPVRFTKEFSRIEVQFRSDDGQFPYNVVVTGNTRGIDITSGMPVQGPFRYTPPQAEKGVFRFRVPRQGDYTLSLELWSAPDAKSGREEEKVDDLILWNALQNIRGFSWAMESLPDLTVVIDYVKSSVSVLVNDWDVSYSLSYTL